MRKCGIALDSIGSKLNKYQLRETELKRLVPGITIVICVMLVAYTGGMATDLGMEWYRQLTLPEFTPPGSFIGIVWTVIYTLGAIAAFLIWQTKDGSRRFSLLLALLVANAVLNALWSWLFFGFQQIGLAIVEMLLLNLSTLAIICLSWPRRKLAAILLAPYFLWVAFATYLACSIWLLNR